MFKRTSVLLLVLLAATATIGAGKSRDFEFISPTVFDRKSDVLVSGRHRDYYLLEPGGKIELRVKGPASLKVFSRIIFETPAESIAYSYLIRRGTKKEDHVSHESRVAEQVVMTADRGRGVGLSRTKLIEVSGGEQTYTISLPKNTSQRILLRFGLDTNAFAKGVRVVAMTPAFFTTSEDMVTKEETATYYRIGSTDSVTLKIIGPATLKVLARVEYDSKMSGKQKWKVQAEEDGRVKATYALSSRKSEVTTYRELTDLVASRAETFFVEIPSGEHRYVFRLPENHRTILLRFLLPENQLEKE